MSTQILINNPTILLKHKNLKDIWTEVYKKKSWEDIYKTFISTEYNHVRSLKFNKKYYKEAHPEALELEHVEIN